MWEKISSFIDSLKSILVGLFEIIKFLTWTLPQFIFKMIGYIWVGVGWLITGFGRLIGQFNSATRLGEGATYLAVIGLIIAVIVLGRDRPVLSSM